MRRAREAGGKGVRKRSMAVRGHRAVRARKLKFFPISEFKFNFSHISSLFTIIFFYFSIHIWRAGNAAGRATGGTAAKDSRVGGRAWKEGRTARAQHR